MQEPERKPISCSCSALLTMWLGWSAQYKLFSAALCFAVISAIISLLAALVNSNPAAGGSIIGVIGFIILTVILCKLFNRRKKPALEQSSPSQPESNLDVSEFPVYSAAASAQEFGFSPGTSHALTLSTNPYVVCPSFPCMLPTGCYSGQKMQVPVPVGYPQQGKLVPFTVPFGSYPGQVINVPLQ